MAQSTLSLSPATLQARNDVGGYFLERYTQADGRTRAANSISAMGAVAGAFAHRQALAMLASGAIPAERRSLVSAAAVDGRTYWFGDAINYVVFEARGPEHLSLFAFLAAAAGVADPEAAIDFVGIFKHAAESVGGGRFGLPRETDLPRPTEPFAAAVAAHLPIIRDRLKYLGVPDADLVTVFAAAAQGLVPILAGERPNIPMTEPLSRLAAVQLFFEAAIPMSKVDPSVTGA